jgi:hypothetical protein
MSKVSSPWFWELRGDGEWLPPEIANIGEGWTQWEGNMADGPDRAAEIFVRELVQNFVDASRDVSEGDEKHFTPHLTFRFVELKGKKAQEFVDKLGLKDHADRYKSIGATEQKQLRIPESNILQEKITSIKLLVVTESYTSGMYGPWEMNDRRGVVRKMRSALLSTVGDKSIGGLGAFGEGKRAIIAASLPRILLTYTAFKTRNETGDVNRRFLGTTYWRPFSEGNRAATGLAVLGKQHETKSRTMNDRPVPLDNDDADAIVRDLNIPFFTPRDPSLPEDQGTSQVFVDPSLTAQDIADSICRNWWPLIEEQRAFFEVFDFEGNEIEIAPDRNRQLKPFIHAFRTLRGDNPPAKQGLRREEISDIQFPGRTTNETVGSLALAADLGDNGWSWEDRENNRSLVALIRDGMIIEYEAFPRVRAFPPPFIRGVFVVDQAKNPLAAETLRMLEPPLHNYWREDANVGQESTKLSKHVYGEIQSRVSAFKKLFKEVAPPNDLHFQVFAEYFKVPDKIVVVPPPPPPPPPESDPWENQSISAKLSEDPQNEARIVASASRILRLKKNFEPTSMKVKISVGWEVLEDGSWSETDDVRTNSIVLDGKSKDLGEFESEISRKSALTVAWTSSPYSNLWTVRPFMRVIEVKDGQ